jgi:hypothetical protein
MLSQAANGRDAVVVARPGKWGNPYSLDHFGRKEAMKLYRTYVRHKLLSGALDLAELRGKNLACWCAPDVACHADVLLVLANR